MAVTRAGVRPVQLEILPVPDARKQTNSEHTREREDDRGLALRVRAHGVGLDGELRLLQCFDHVNALPEPRRHEVPEHGNVVVSHVPVSDRAHFAVAEMIAGQKIVLVKIKLRTISAD